MRVRIKFSKYGMMKYIGHLDVMRFFQKVLRRAEIDVAFSEGFSPHMLMSFAQPLGVGVTSEAEYFDLDLKSDITSKELIDKMNVQMPEGICVTEAVKIKEDKASKGMTLVDAADYDIKFDDKEEFLSFRDKLEDFLSQKEIIVLKKTKRSEALTDIKPLIYEYIIGEDKLFLKLSSGSKNNLKPQLVINSFIESSGIKDIKFHIHRKELYTVRENKFIPLYKLGEEIL